MITRRYSYLIAAIDHEVIHLFEHLVLLTFLKVLQKEGYTRSLIGWVNGETSDTTLSFDIGTYWPEVIELFEEHTKGLTQFTKQDISCAIAHIEAEMQEKAVIADEVQLVSQLNELVGVVQGMRPTVMQGQRTPLIYHRRAGEFRYQEFIIKVASVSDNDKVLFLGLYPIILDILRDALSSISAYPVGVSSLLAGSGTIGVIWQLSIARDVDMQNIVASMKELVRVFDVQKYQGHFKDYFNSYMHDDVFKDAPDQYRQQTGMDVERSEVARQATIEHINRLFAEVMIELTYLSKREREELGLL